MTGNRYERPWDWRTWLEFVATAVIAGAVCVVLGLMLAGCYTPPTPKPPAPSPPVYFFDLATRPSASCTITIEGYAKGPQRAPNGYVYVDGYQSPISQGAILAECDGFVPKQLTGQAWAELQHVNELQGHNFIDLEPLTPAPPPMPAVPSRGELLRAPHTFQGLRANCPEYDTRPLPIFDVMIDTVGEACKQSILDAHEAAGDRVIAIALSHAYLEPGIEAPISTGHDWTYDLPGLHAFIRDLITRPRHDGQHWLVQLHLAGDGGSLSRNSDGSWRYNDPVGWTYGYEFLRDFFPRLADALDDLHGYVRFVNGFDGVFYGWDPAQAVAFAQQFKRRWPDGTLGIEFNVGHIPFGEGGDDYLPGGRMSLYDLLLGEFPRPLTGDDVWQIIGRLVFPYRRPPDQPATDDPNPPFYLRLWPGVFDCWEWGIYDDVRFHATPADIGRERQQLRAMGCPFTG